MPLDIPSRRQVATTLQSYVRAELPGLDPTPSRRSKIGAWIKSVASGCHDWYVALKDYGDHEPFPQSARGQFLYSGWWRPLTKLDPLPPAAARGNVVLTGIAGTPIPAGLTFSANAKSYTSQNATAIVQQSVGSNAHYDVSSGFVIVVTPIPHEMADGLSVTVSGSSIAQLNGTFTVQIVSETSLRYAPSAVPGSSAIVSVTLTATWAVAIVQADSTGAASNVSGGGTLTVTTALAGVSTTATATAGGISGGLDAESAEAYRSRILKALGTDFGAFTGDEIEIVARSVPGVTRVFVRKATIDGSNGVYEGQVRVAFMCDGLSNPIPTAQKAADVKAAIVAHCMTANTAIEDVFVTAPTPHVVNFNFTSISPDTIGMREAVRSSLRQLFDEGVHYGESVAALDYECAIKSSVDLNRQAILRAFTLSAPSGNISIGLNEMPILGAITFGAA